MKKYIYLDWNVIQHTKHKNQNFKGAEFAQFIEKAKQKYIFPASTIHLMDLSQGGTNEEHLEYVTADLDYLSELSDNFLLELNSNQEVILSRKSIEKKFEEASKYEAPSPTLQVSKFRHEVDIKKIEKNDIFLDLIKNNDNVFDHTVVNKFTQNLKEIITQPTEYKHLRDQIKITSNYAKICAPLLPKNIISFFELTEINEVEEMKKNYKRIISSLLSSQNIKFDRMKSLDLIKASYLALDFSPIFSEKISKKNKPTNMQRDAFNLMLASKAEYYVTEDDNNYEKAKFIADVLNLDVKIKKMDEIRNSFNFI